MPIWGQTRIPSGRRKANDKAHLGFLPSGLVVEAAGIAPASRDPSASASTCVAVLLSVSLRAPIGEVPFGLSHHELNPSRNGRLSSDDPALTSSGGASGRRPVTKPMAV